MATVYHKILQEFPKGYCLAFAYGSGVFRQVGQNPKANMMDFILAVDDSETWHRDNILRNPHHYFSILRWCGAHFVARTQDNWGAKTYFNTLVKTNHGLIKYGVINRANLLTDLLDWDTLYLAGRLHKPVYMLHRDADFDDIKDALRLNLFCAMHTALLTLPNAFSENDLYLTLAALSYSGDFRMHYGEDQNKVNNIVHAQKEKFRQLYTPIVTELSEYLNLNPYNGMCQQNMEPAARLYHLSMLPKTLQSKIVKKWNEDGRNRDLEDVLRAASQDDDCGDIVQEAVEDIVHSSSWKQSGKGILTAGLSKSVRYSLAKVRKMVKSRKSAS